MTKNQDVDMEDSEAPFRAHSAKGGGKRRWQTDKTPSTQYQDPHQAHPIITTIFFTTISPHLPQHRPEGKPGEPRDTRFPDQNTTTSYDHFSAKRKNNCTSQRLQRNTRSTKKRGKRSQIAETTRKTHRSSRRNYHRRWYRWCKSNIGTKHMNLERRRLGNGSLDFPNRLAS